MQIVLASSSPYRQQQLQTLGLDFTCASPDIDESRLPGENASTMALRLAAAKAYAVAGKFPGALVIGCDQTVAFGEQILGKPGSFDAAVQQLQTLRGQSVIFHSAIALLDHRHGMLQQQDIATHVRYRNLDDTQIHQYLQRDEPFNCAGSFKSESLGIAILESVNSDDPSALVGLPLIALTSMLANVGVDVLDY
ncbi:MAG TPA: Maf family nucleotide pyrophosphatase [Pseudomonadales bacterium]|nr:Maf family nucleotide pyrophosphatase [Pseudomonadales bacterium]